MYFGKSAYIIGQVLVKISGPNILLIKLLCKANTTRRLERKKENRIKTLYVQRSSFRERERLAGVSRTKRRHLQLPEITKTTKCSISYCCESITLKKPVRNWKKILRQDKWVLIVFFLIVSSFAKCTQIECCHESK